MWALWYNHSMPKPDSKYLEIAATLKREILEGKYEDSERFPSEEALARRFGASRPTIERALRELKRAGLLEARAGSGFYLTFAARNATGVIGLIAPDYGKIDFFTDLCGSIAEAARAEGYGVLLGDATAPGSKNRAAFAVSLARAFAERRTAGVLLEPVDLVPDSQVATRRVLDILAERHIPVVLLDRDYVPPPARSEFDLVGIDNFAAGYRLGRHLIDAGARSIRFLTQSDYASTIRSRIHGVAQAAIDAGLAWNASCVVETDPADVAAFRRLMRGKGRPDAFVCRNDPLAARLLQTLSALKIKVPGKVKVAGFDDAKIATLLNPPLTTIRQPIAELASTAVASLLQRIREPSLAPRAILLDAPMVARASTGA